MEQMNTTNGNLSKAGMNSSLPSVLESSSPLAESLPLKVTKLICYTLVFLIGVVGNTMVFRIILRRRKLQTVSNYFICNLAAADIAVLTVNLPFRLAYQENSYIWPFGPFICKIIPMLTYLFITASSLTLVLMSLDQHRAVVYPFEKRLTITQTKIVMVIVWLASILLTLPLNFFLQIIYRKGNPICTDVWPSLKFEQIYFVFLFFVQFVIPMTIITTAYTHVCMRLNSQHSTYALPQSVRQREKRNKKATEEEIATFQYKIISTTRTMARHFIYRYMQDRVKSYSRPSEISIICTGLYNPVIKMLIFIVVVNAACTLPYHITWLFSLFGHPHSIAKKFCVLLVIATSAAHPIIYGTLNKDFARGFKSYGEYLRCIKGQVWSSTSSNRSHEAQQTKGFTRFANNCKTDLGECKKEEENACDLSREHERTIVSEYETVL